GGRGGRPGRGVVPHLADQRGRRLGRRAVGARPGRGPGGGRAVHRRGPLPRPRRGPGRRAARAGGVRALRRPPRRRARRGEPPRAGHPDRPPGRPRPRRPPRRAEPRPAPAGRRAPRLHRHPRAPAHRAARRPRVPPPPGGTPPALMIGVPTPDLPLFPVPRSVEPLAGPGPRPDAPVAVRPDADLPAQGYWIERDADGTRIGYRDAAGLRYAQQTLDQLRADAELARQAVRVRDWPDFPVRGFMLDVSRDRVPTRRTLRRYVEILAAARMNQLELYTEHTFAYARHSAVWAAASPLTADDMRWLDALCAAHGIALVANQNTLGHMERWLAHEAYRDRAEKPDGFTIHGRHRGPSTLQPTPENAEFALGLVRELAATVRARRVNIGADEPWELGKGRSAADAAARGPGRDYVDHLLRVATPLLEDGYEVQFWADVLADHPEIAGRLPEGLIP